MKNLSIGNKILLGVAVAVAVATLAAIITVQFLASTNRVHALQHEMSGLLAQSETMIENMDAMHGAEAFDQPHLVALAKEQIGNQSLKQAYAKTDFYQTIPVVAAWKAAAESAKKNGYEFYTPSHPEIPARNPKNNNGSDFAAAFKAFEAGESEYFFQDKERGELVLARPIHYSKSCLTCHGDPANSPTKDGLDVLGVPMENAKLGDLKGAFVLKAKVSNDPIVASTVKSMTLVGLVVLAGVIVGFQLVNRKFMVKPLNGIIAQINSNSAQVSAAASELSATSQTLAEGASEQAASLEETSASLEEIAAMTRRNSEHAANGRSLGAHARQAATTGQASLAELTLTLNSIKSAVADMQAAVGESQASSQEISKIIKTIDEIAFQTNLLALNAAVEAARAGEAGMGFAVVADEVRALAQRSAQAARDTSNKIEAAVKRSELGGIASSNVVKSLAAVETTAQNIQQVFSGIAEQIKALDQVITEIAAASQEQTQGISEVNMAVSQMDKVTQSNAASAEENAASSEELNAQALATQDVIGRLEILVTGSTQHSPAWDGMIGGFKNTKKARTAAKPRPTKSVPLAANRDAAHAVIGQTAKSPAKPSRDNDTVSTFENF